MLSKLSSVLFSLAPLLKRKNLSREFFLTAKNNKKKSFLQGKDFHFTHIVSGAFLAS